MRQGDSISLKLLTLALEDVFKHLSWTSKTIKVDGSYLNHLRFADDIVLISSDVYELKEMLDDLNNASKTVGLSMNLHKTKTMRDSNIEVVLVVNNQIIDNVDKYKYI